MEDGQESKQAIADMLPRDGAIVAAPDAEIALVRAISKYRAIQAVKLSEFWHANYMLAGVEPFRQKALEGRLLELDQVEAWISDVAQREGPPSVWLTGLPLNDGDYTYDLINNTITITQPIRVVRLNQEEDSFEQHVEVFSAWEAPVVSRRFLVCYVAPDSDAVSYAVQAGGILDYLRRLSLTLADRYYWEPELAATFVLTGLVPYDQDALSYVRTALVNGRRPRPMSIKHLELACFTAEHEGQSQAERIASWNALHPEWAYKDIANFGRDSRQAVKNLRERDGWQPHRNRDSVEDIMEHLSRWDTEKRRISEEGAHANDE